MGRSISSTSSANTLLGEVVDLVSGGNVVTQNDGVYLKANGQEVLKADFPALATFLEGEIAYENGGVLSGSGFLFAQPGVNETMVTFQDRFYVFYNSALPGPGTSSSVAYSVSTDGTTWSYPERIVGTGEFRNFRIYNNKLIVVGTATTVQFDGTSWSTLCALPLYDIAYNGTTWIGVNNTTTIYKSTDGITWTTQVVAVVFTSMLWTGTSFFSTTAAGSSSYKSADGTTWSSATTSSLGNASTLVGNKTLQVNGFTLVPTDSGFMYSSNLTTWTSGYMAGATSSYRLSCVYTGGFYYISYGSASLGKYTALDIAPTEYLYLAANINIVYNAINSTFLVSTGSDANKIMTKFISTPPVAFASIGAIPMWSTAGALGNGYYVTYSNLLSGSYMMLMVEDKDNLGMFKHIKGTVSQGYIGVIEDGVNFSHYAKDVGILYFAAASVYTATKYTSVDFNTGLCGVINTVGIDYGGTRSTCVLHSKGWVYWTGAAQGSTCVVGNKYYEYTLGIACTASSGDAYVSSDGSEIFAYETATPFRTIRSLDGGASFSPIKTTVYSATGAVVAPASGLTALVKINGKYYSKLGGYAGSTPYTLFAGTGFPIMLGRVVGIHDNLCLTLNNPTSLVTEVQGNIAVVASSNIAGIQYYKKANGNIVVKYGTTIAEFIAPVIDADKFTMPSISSTGTTAKYIKGTL